MTRARGALAGAAALAAVLTGPGPAGAQTVSYDGSIRFATGNYLFSEPTRTVSALTGLRVQWDRVTFTASLPVVYQSTPWISLTGPAPIPTGGPQHGAVHDSLRRRGGGGGNGGHGMGSVALPQMTGDGGGIPLPDTATFDDVGIGDPTAGLSVDLVRQDRGTPLTLSARGDLKVPVASVDRGFGTGAWDVGVGLAAFRSVGRAYFFADAEYWALGDLEDFELRDPVSYAVGVGYGTGTLALLGMFSGYSRIVEGTDPPMDVSLGLSYFLEGGSALNATVAAGLTESSPDLSVGAGWSLAL